VRKKAFQGRVQDTQANGELHIRRQEEKPIDEEAWQVNAELRVSEQLAVVLIESAVAEEFADARRAKGHDHCKAYQPLRIFQSTFIRCHVGGPFVLLTPIHFDPCRTLSGARVRHAHARG